MFHKKTIRDVDISGKTVLLRADYNVPIDNAGKIISDFRIGQSLPTIEYLLQNKCKIIICSHLGRPDGKPDSRYSLRPVAEVLQKKLQQKVSFVDDCIGTKAKEEANKAAPGDIVLLENLRFYPGELENNELFARQLADLGEVFIQDAFGVVHRKQASLDAITRLMPSVSGLLVEKEVNTITQVMNSPNKPLMALIGGAKISDKIDILKRLISIADFVAVGGAMANTFLLAKGINIGESMAEENDIEIAQDIMELAEAESKKRKFIFYLPQDSVVAEVADKHAKTRIVDWSAHVIASIEHYPKQPPSQSGLVGANELILDIGPFSASFISGSMQMMNTVIWNGTMGVTEVPSIHGPSGPFSHGSELLVESMLGNFGSQPFSFIGGGDTVAYIESKGLEHCFDHVSTGGGASLDLMAGKKLPGVEALQDRKK